MLQTSRPGSTGLHRITSIIKTSTSTIRTSTSPRTARPHNCPIRNSASSTMSIPMSGYQLARSEFDSPKQNIISNPNANKTATCVHSTYATIVSAEAPMRTNAIMQRRRQNEAESNASKCANHRNHRRPAIEDSSASFVCDL